MGEGQVENLQYLEERAEPIDVPVFVLFGDPAAEVHVVENRGDEWQNEVRVSLVKILEPEHASTCELLVFSADHADREDHDDEDGQLDQVVEEEGGQAGVRLLGEVEDGAGSVPHLLGQGELAVLEQVPDDAD